MATFALANFFDLLEVDPPTLLYRENGDRALPILERRIRAVPEPGTLVLDGAGVALMDASFVDAALLELAHRLGQGQYGDRFLVVENITEGTRTNIASAIARRHLHNKQEIIVLIREGDELLPVGDMERNLLEAWNLVRDGGAVTARGLADQLRLEISAAGMRLKRLYDARLIVRSGGGRQLVYSVPA